MTSSSKPICTPLRKDPNLHEWQQVIELFRRHGLEDPPVRLRDEIVVLMSWAWYGQELDAQAGIDANSAASLD